jgi:hypothetical protein
VVQENRLPEARGNTGEGDRAEMNYIGSRRRSSQSGDDAQFRVGERVCLGFG